MKNTIILFVAAIACSFGLSSFTVLTAKGEIVKTTTKGSVLSWKSESIDLGQIPQSVPKTVEFEFKNTGKTDIIIKDAHASCGCTGTKFPKETIKPGATAKISATFNAAAKGPFSKTVTVTTTADDAPKVLSFKGTVI